MKKILALILALLMVFALVSCGSDGEQGGDKPDGGKKETTVELTLDNWRDYFEFRMVVHPITNSFDEVTSVLCRMHLFLKDDIAESVKALNDVAVEYTSTEPYACRYEYNLETGELVRKEAADMDSGAWGGKIEGDTNLYFISDVTGEGMRLTASFDAFDEVVDGDIVSFISAAFEKIELVRVKGSLTVER